MEKDYSYLLSTAIKAAIAAGSEIMHQYQNGFQVFTKEDDSPVTSADLVAHDILASSLKETAIAVLSEEGEKFDHNFRQNNAYWCLDPIDGTKDFVNKTDEFCISIGLIENNTATVGILYAPALDLFYWAAEGIGAYKFNGNRTALEKMASSSNLLQELLNNATALPAQEKPEQPIFLTSRFHSDTTTNQYIEQLKEKNPDLKVIRMGCAIKLGIVAERKATEYTRFMAVNFWDIAGGHAIAKYTGLNVINPKTKEEIGYQAEDMRVHGYSIQW